jgi:hypothetical protein
MPINKDMQLVALITKRHFWLLFAGLLGLGAAGGYYYNNTGRYSLSTSQVNQKKPVDYQQVYKDIVEILEDNE